MVHSPIIFQVEESLYQEGALPEGQSRMQGMEVLVENSEVEGMSFRDNCKVVRSLL